MIIHSESRIHHPRDVVYRTYRDRLSEIAAYIPDVKRIVVLSKEERAGGMKFHNEWVADREIPRLMQVVVKPEMLRWDDYADWHDGDWHCDWRLELRTLKDRVSCHGTNTFFELGSDHTKVVLAGSLEIDLSNFPGIPRILAGRLAPQVEKFIVSLITPNLEKVNGSLERFLDDDQASIPSR
jgi:hypothetical protein